MAASVETIVVGVLVALGVLLMAAAIASKVFDLGVMLRPRAKGAECGECGYLVEGLVGPHCPECGADLRKVGVVEAGKERPVRLIPVWTMVVLAVPAAVASVMLPPMVGMLPGVRMWQASEMTCFTVSRLSRSAGCIVVTWRGRYSLFEGKPEIHFLRRGAAPAEVSLAAEGGTGARLVINHAAGAFRVENLPSGPREGRLPLSVADLDVLWTAAGDGDAAARSETRPALEALASLLSSGSADFPMTRTEEGLRFFQVRTVPAQDIIPLGVKPVVWAVVWGVWGLVALWQFRRWRRERAAVEASRLGAGRGAEGAGRD